MITPDAAPSRRERYTVRAIRESLIDLLREGPEGAVTVRALCERADINRSTFYRHYTDIVDLRERLADELHDELFTRIAADALAAGDSFERDGREQILRALRVIESERAACEVFTQQDDGAFLRRLMGSTFELYLRDHLSRYPDSPEVRLHYRYLIGGLGGVLLAWLADGGAVGEEVVADLVHRHISGFFDVLGRAYSA